MNRLAAHLPIFLPILIVLSVFLAYSNTLHCPFIFDDVIMLEKISTGNIQTVIFEMGSRPLSNISLYLNYKLGGANVLGYHLFNIFLQCLNSLILYLLVYKTLTLPRFEETCSHTEKRILSFAVAAFWGIHPLSTESVTYIVQRGEALCGTFLFLSMLLILLGEGSSSKWSRFTLFSLSLISCIAGFGAKEAMISAPFIIIIYDRVFLCEGWHNFFRKRGWFYGLSFLLLSIPAIVSGLAANYVSSAFFTDHLISPLDYFMNQTKVIFHYLELSVFPSGQCFDYCWPATTSYLQLLPYLASLIILLALASWLLYKNKYLGFCGLYFFISLAPRSSFAPRPDLAVEHRMYIPLAVLCCLTVFGIFFVIKRFSSIYIVESRRKSFLSITGILFLVFAISGYGLATFKRNSVYKTEFSLWKDTVDKAPGNPRALNYLGIEYCRNRNLEAATECFVKALEIHPDFDLAMNNLANVMAMEKRFDMALELYKKSILTSSVKKNKTVFQTLSNMSKLYSEKKDWDSAIKISLFILERWPGNQNANYMLGRAFLNKGDPVSASEYFLKVMDPSIDGNSMIGKIAGDISSCPDNAAKSIVLKQLLAKHSSSAELNYEYGVMLLNDSKLKESKEYFEGTLAAMDFSKRAYSINNLGVISQKEKLYEAAETYFREAISIKPDYAAAHFNLGILLGNEKKDFDAAVKELEIALSLAPNELIIKKMLEQFRQKKGGKQ